MTLLVFVSVAGMVTGVLGLVAATRGRRPVEVATAPGSLPADPFPAVHVRTWRARRLVMPAAAAGVVGVVTRWPVGALAAALATAALPALLGRGAGAKPTDRVEAVAAWTELLRDTLAAAAGLSQAIVVTAPVAPKAVRAEVVRLADRLTVGVPMTDALRVFAAELDDPGADVVVCALLLAASARSQRLVDLLGALADSIREEVSMRLRIEASRASARSGVRTVVVFSLVFAGALAVLAHSYLAPFGTLTGQLVLALVVSCYAAGLVLMVRMVRPPSPVRLLGAGGNR